MSTVGGGTNIVKDGLVLYLDAANSKSYVSGSTTWNDMSRNGYTGTLVSGSGYSSTNGGSIVFDGVNDYVSIPYSSALGLSSQGSLSVWCYPTTLSQNLYAGLVGMTLNGVSNGQSYYLHWRKASNLIQAGIQNNGVYNLISYSLPVTISWYNIVFTWNGSFLNLYQNGTSMTTPITQTISAQLLNRQVDIGGNMFGADGTNQGGFTGYIPQTQIYNRALSAQEIIQNYNATRTRFNL
jgi:hypothetical protein